VTNRWYAREYNDGDEQAILGLHETVFGAELSSEWWTWLYKQNPTGQGIIVVAEADRRIVGHYALIPLSMKVGDEICLGSLSLDTMIHPDWRNQGIFTKLAKKAYDLAAERGIHFVYGFPNRNSHHGFITRLGWTDLYKGIPLWVKPLRYENVLQTYTKGNKKAAKLLGKLSQGVVRLLYRSRSRIPQVSIKEVPSFDERFDALWSMTSLEYEIIVVRNITYLNWRYAEKPNGNYFIFTAERDGRLLGYMVLKCMELFGLQTGFLVDIMSPRNHR
jgi:predicted N-acetyltransferase YhbS